MATLSQLFVGLFSAATGGYSNQFKTSDANSLASVASLVAGKDLSSDTNYINYVLGNMGVTSSSTVYAQAFTAMQGLVTTQGRGNAVVTAVDFLAGQSKDKTSAYYDIANGFLASVAKAEAFTVARPNEVSIANLVAGVSGSGGAFSLGSGTDTLYGVLGNEVFAGVNTASATVIQSTDSITDSSTTDVDTLNLTLLNGMTDSAQASTMPTIRNIETINFNVNATTTPAYLDGGDTSVPSLFVADASSVTGVKNLNFDVVKDVSAVNGVKVIGVANNATVTGSAKIKNITALPTSATSALNVVNNAVGTTGTPATITTTLGSTDGSDLTATGAGYLTVTASDGSHGAKGFVNATAAKGLTLTADVAAVVYGTALGGNLTLASDDATIVRGTATGNITVAGSGAGSVTLDAGGSITASGLDATSITVASVGNSSLGTADDATTLSLSSKGTAASTYTATSLAGLQNVFVDGAGDISLTVPQDALGDGFAVKDSGAGKFTLTLDTPTAAGSLDLSQSDIIDVLAVKADLGHDAASTLAVPTGQTVTFKTSQTNSYAASVATGVAANGATNVVNVILDDGSRVSGAVSLNGVTFSGAKTVNIDASVDTASGVANPSTLTGLVAYGATATQGATLTVNAGLNGVTFAGATDVKASGTLAVTGSGNVAFGTGTLTAAVLDASAVTGKVTGTGLNTTYVKNILTGSGEDSFSLATAAKGFTMKTGDGKDTVTLYAGDYTNEAVSIDLGAGSADTLALPANAKLTAGTSGKVTLAGVEAISMSNSTGSAQIDANLLSGQTYTLKTDATGATKSTNALLVALTDTNIDLSTIVASTASDSAIAAQTYLIDASDASRTAGITIKGLVGAKNKITGSAFSDALTGGDKADTFVYTGETTLFNSTSGALYDTIAGGVGSDVLLINPSSSSAALSIPSTVNWANASSVEYITTGGTTGNVSVVLGASAEAEGIKRVTLGAVTGTSGTTTRTVDASAYASLGVTLSNTGASSTEAKLVGGGGNDTITGQVGSTDSVDTLVGGAGDDTFVYAADSSLFTSGNAAIDVINGGTGVNTLLVGDPTVDTPVTTTFTIVALDSFAGITNVQNIKAVANSGIQTITLNADAWAAGIRSVDISATLKADSNVVSATNITSGSMTLTGSAVGATSITGGSGNDTITGGSANDTLNGGSGNDSITAAAGFDSIDGGSGNDWISAGDGNDTIVESTGTDTIDGGDGNDSITIGAVGDVVTAGSGDDTIASGSAIDTLTANIDGGEGNDTLTLDTSDNLTGATISNVEVAALASGASVTLSVAQLASFTDLTGSGTETVTLTGAGGSVKLDADIEAYVGTNLTSAATVSGAASAGKSLTFNSKYNNSVTITGSSDVTAMSVTTGLGNDSITVSSAVIAASTTNIDTITAGAGTDSLTFTGNTAVTIDGSTGAAITGIESFKTSQTTSSISLTLGASYAVASGATLVIDATSLTTGEGTFDVHTLAVASASVTGGAANDTFTGSAQADNLAGGEGDDTFNSSAGKDTIAGGEGNDSITIGAAAQVIDGGLGDDSISSSSSHDTLTATIDGGEGDDVLTLDNGDNISGATFVNVEFLALDDNAHVTMTIDQHGSFDEVTGADVEQITLTGAGGSIVLSSDIETYVGTNLTSAVTVTGAAVEDQVLTFDSIYSNKLTLTGSTNVASVSITTGAGNDAITIGSGVIGTSNTDLASIEGGNGTDSLTFTGNVEMVIEPGTGAVVTGIESFKTSQTTNDVTLNVGPSYTIETGATLVIDGSSLTTGNGSFNVSGLQVADASVTGGAAADSITGSNQDDTLLGGAGNDSISGGEGEDSIIGGAGNDEIDLEATLGGTTIVFGASASSNGVDTITNFLAADNGASVVGDLLDFTAFFGFAPMVYDDGGAGLAEFAPTVTTLDKSLSNRVAVLDLSGAASDSTASDVLDEIAGTGNSFALSSGKAVVIVENQSGNSSIYYIDTTTDGLTGLSVNDIKLVGTIDAIATDLEIGNLV